MLGKIALLMNEWLGNAKYICNYVLVVQAHRYRHVLKNCVRFLRVARRRLKRIKVYRRRFSFLLKGLTKRRYETQRHFFVWSLFNSTCARCLWIDERHQSQQTSRRNHADNTTESTVNGNVTCGQTKAEVLSEKKCYQLSNCFILKFENKYCPFKTVLSGNTVWQQALGFQRLVKFGQLGLFARAPYFAR